MRMSVRVEGLDKALKALNKDIIKEGGERCYRGLLRGGILIVNGAVKRAPIHTGNLRGSAFIYGRKDENKTVPEESQKPDMAKAARVGEGEPTKIQQHLARSKLELLEHGAPAVLIGFSASYALFVHEAPDTHQMHQGENQFLTKSVEDNHDRVIGKVRQEVKKNWQDI